MEGTVGQVGRVACELLFGEPRRLIEQIEEVHATGTKSSSL